jgi:hypothetical protein
MGLPQRASVKNLKSLAQSFMAGDSRGCDTQFFMLGDRLSPSAHDP